MTYPESASSYQIVSHVPAAGLARAFLAPPAIFPPGLNVSLVPYFLIQF